MVVALHTYQVFRAHYFLRVCVCVRGVLVVECTNYQTQLLFLLYYWHLQCRNAINISLTLLNKLFKYTLISLVYF